MAVLQIENHCQVAQLSDQMMQELAAGLWKGVLVASHTIILYLYLSDEVIE